jgi:hypothetical protein
MIGTGILMSVIPDVEPMLAEAGVPTSVDGWVAEPKLDGSSGLPICEIEGPPRCSIS